MHEKRRVLLKITAGMLATCFAAIIFPLISRRTVAIQATADETVTEKLLLQSKNLTYAKYPDDGGNAYFWCRAEGDKDCFANPTDAFYTPGATYNIALCFTAPFDMTLGENFGTMQRQYAVGNDKGDGVYFSMIREAEKLYPENKNEELVPEDLKDITLNKTLSLSRGEKLYFMLSCGDNHNSAWDSAFMRIAFSYTTESGGGTFVATDEAYTTEESGEDSSEHFAGFKKNQIVSYQYLTVKKGAERADENTDGIRVILSEQNLICGSFNGIDKLWLESEDKRNTFYSHYGAYDYITPGEYDAVALRFTAPCNGRISNAFGCGEMINEFSSEQSSDGVRISVVVKNEVIYPSRGMWKNVPYAGEESLKISFNSIDLKKGETLYYIVDNGGNSNIAYDSAKARFGFMWKSATGERYVDLTSEYAAEGTEENVSFGAYKKKDVISYVRISYLSERKDVGEVSMVESGEKLSLAKEDAYFLDDHYYAISDSKFLVYKNWVQPGYVIAVGIEWTAPEDGRVDISGTYLKLQDWCAYYLTHPTEAGVYANGVRFRILKNDCPAYPATDWCVVNTEGKHSIEDFGVLSVKAGDRLTLLIDANKELNFDCVETDFIINFAKTDSKFTARYGSVLDFEDEEKSLAWKFYAVTITDETERKLTSGESEIPSFSYMAAKGGCFSSINGKARLTISSVAVFVASISILRRNKNKEGEGDDKKTK